MDRGRLEEVAQRHGVVLLLEFGSIVSGHLHPQSDVDLGVLLERPAFTTAEWSDLQGDLQGLIPDRKVDLAVLDRADPFFLWKVVERCRLLHGSPRRLAELKMYAFRRYQDHRRYLALEKPYVERALARLTSP
jgi:predicted nucleotidyltransferase